MARKRSEIIGYYWGTTVVLEGSDISPAELKIVEGLGDGYGDRVVDTHIFVKEGTDVNSSIGNYFSTMLDQSMNWKDAEKLCAQWGGHFALKGIMSVEDAKKAVDIGCTGIMVSNHGGRQLDGSRSPFDQLAEIVDAVGDKLDVICEGGIHRGTHMLKALSLGAKACSGGRLYLYALAAAGQAGVERALEKYKSELVRDMKLMGCTKISELSRSNLRFRR